MLLDVFHGPLRWCAAGLCFVGTGFAGWAAIASTFRAGTGEVLAFGTVAVVTAGFGLLVLRAAHWALWTVAVVFAGQVFAVAGTVAELASGVDAAKAADLRRLGVDPTLGVVLNLMWSALAAVLSGWLVVRWRRARRYR